MSTVALQDLPALRPHPDPAAAGRFKAMTDVLRTSCFRMYIGHFESELSVAYIHSESQPEGWLIALVEIPGFEPGQREPKSLVLPLHHTSIPCAKILLFLFFCKLFRIARKQDSRQGILQTCRPEEVPWSIPDGSCRSQGQWRSHRR